jgi:hypothetical protein
LVFDLLSGCFTQWSIDPYTKNDIVSAPELAVKAGDLVLRDRGYFTTDECKRIQQARADFVSRYKHKTTLWDPQTGQEVDLIRLLDTQRNLDQCIAIGGDPKTTVRLVALEVSQETASPTRIQGAQSQSSGVVFDGMDDLPHQSAAGGPDPRAVDRSVWASLENRNPV